MLGLPAADPGAAVETATLRLTIPADAWPGCVAAAVAALRADAVPGGVAAVDPSLPSARSSAGDRPAEPVRRRRRREPEPAPDAPAAPAETVVAVHLHPVADLADLVAGLTWATTAETGGEKTDRTADATVDPAALARRAFGRTSGGAGSAAVVAVTGLDALREEATGGTRTGGGFGAVAGPAGHPDDAPPAVAAEHLRRLAFAAGPDGDPDTADAPPGPPTAGGWEVRLVRFPDPGPPGPAGEDDGDGAATVAAPAGPHYLVAAPVADPAAFARRLAAGLPGVAFADLPEPPAAGGDEGEVTGTAPGAADPATDAAAEEEEEDPAWAAFLADGRTAGAAGSGPAAVFVAAATGGAEALTDPAALPAPCAGDAAAFAGTLSARRRARDAAAAAGGHDLTLWEQSQSSEDRTPRPGEGDLTWALRVVADGCEDDAARREAYGLLAAADPAAADRGDVVAVLAETLPAAVRARDGAAHLAAMLRWADGPAELRRVGEAAAAARTPRVGQDLLALLAADDASRGAADPARLHAALPLLTALGVGGEAAEYLRSAGGDAAPALLTRLDPEAPVDARRAAVNLLDGPPRLARPADAAALLAAAKAEPDAALARRLRLLANRLGDD